MSPRTTNGEAAAVALTHRAVAERTATWEELAGVVRRCTACADLAASRTTVVVGQHPPGSRLLLVGEAPGAQEDAEGEPFVGRSGQLLDEALAAAGLARSDVAVANVLKCRPPGNRTPTRAETVRCRPWLDRQLQLVDPLLVITLGGTAAASFFGASARIGALRGAVHDVDGRRVLVTYHPSAALRFGPRGEPARALREDLLLAAGVLTGLRGAGAR